MKTIKPNEWGNFRYFKEHEFLCKCGICDYSKTTSISYEFVEMLDKAREIAGTPFKISSGQRCTDHNRKVGGSANSDHLVTKTKLCTGVDILVSSDAKRYKIDEALHTVKAKRIGIYRTFYHIGLGNKNTVPIKWTN
jgi:hypothetical protein